MPPERLTRSSRTNAAWVAALVALILLSNIYSSTMPVVSGSLSPNQAPIQNFSLTEWGVPTAGAGPAGIGVDGLGKIWVTENSTSKIARFDPASNTFTEWNVPTSGSQPGKVFVKQITVSGANVTEVFFTENASNKIALFNASNNSYTEWQLPTGSSPVGIYVDEQSDIWFTESGRDIIGRLTPSTNELTEWTLPGATTAPGSPLLEPWGIYVQLVTRTGYSNRFIWFTEFLNNKIGRLEANSNRLTLWDLNSLGLGSYQPTDITFAVINGFTRAVFANENSNRISILGNETGGGSFYEEALIVTTSAEPQAVTFDSSRSAVWFVEKNAGNIAGLNTTSIQTPQLLTPTYCTMAPTSGSPSCPTPATTTQSLAATTQTPGVSGSSTVQNPALSSLISVYQGPFNGITEYRLPNVASRPSSLSLDSLGNIWFTESNVTVSRIGRFGTPYAFKLSVSPTSQTVSQGQNATYTVNIALLSGSPLPVQLRLLNAPASTTVQFSPQTASPPFTSTLTIATTTSTVNGNYTMSVQASSAGPTQSSTITLRVQTTPPPPPTPFNYTIAVTSARTVTILQGQSASFDVTVSLTSGTAQPVNLTATDLPPETTYSFTVPTVIPTFTSTLNVQTNLNTPAGSYPITISGSSNGVLRQPAQGPVLVVTEVPRDFNLAASASKVTLVQGSQTQFTLTLASTGVFNGNVALTGSFSPSPPDLKIVFIPSTVTLQPNGGSAQATAIIVARANTAGTYQLTVTGTSGTPSLSHKIVLTVQVSPCLIATATFGSELAPEVQFLRDFRDQQITNTFAGSNFMIAFNAWYYSFSPTIAQYEYSEPTARTSVKVMLYPAIDVLRLASYTYSVLGFQPELAALATGLVASFLIGLLYLTIPALSILWFTRNTIDTRTKRRVTRFIAVTFAGLIVAFAVSEILAVPVVMMLVSAGIVLTTLAAGGILPALEIIAHFRKKD
jgi:streptogramin lyase